MRRIWRTSHHIRYAAFAMAVIVGLLPPCAALAAEEDISEEDIDISEEETEEEDSDSETDVAYITAFESLAEEDAFLSCMEKPSLEELTDLFPETLLVWLEGEEESVKLEVEWESEKDFEETKLERYTFQPKWDEDLYVIADSAEETIEIPTITVEVPVEKEMIPELEEARKALRDIIENKSILALVYLCDKYEVKREPSADADTVHTVVSGQSVQITDADLDENGSVWYQTLFYQNGAEYTGYIERGYLAASDEDFVEWEATYIELPPAPRMMKSRRAAASYPDVDQFPASYQNALYELKANHPNWIFVRMDTGIDWNTAISKEMGDKSLVPSGSSGSWQNGIYGQGWSYASEGILKYYMDPRNFLTDPAIFQFEQLTYNDSYHTAGAVQEILKNSFMSSTIPGDSQTYAQAFNAIGKTTGVSPFHLASRVLQEQGTKGTSALISGNYSGYEGYYNYFNVGASGKTDAQVVQSGLKKAKEQGWNTRYKSLSGGAYLIGANYILKGQDTLYLEKFNVSNGYHANFTHQYMQNIQAPNSEASNIRKAYNNAGALENSFVFKIPVYSNMPASACTKPNTTDTISLDQTAVSNLQVNKTVTLIPYVNGSKVDYISNMTFSSDNTSVATVDSTGKITAISPGSAVISCTRSGAGTAVCTVTVVKADPDVSTPTLSPCTYREGLRLADISLPNGWKWVNENTKMEAGTHSYDAIYTPEDSVKYNTVTKKISFTVTKAIPSCTMPEKPKVSVGSTLGEIVLPQGFVWESDTETELQEPGEYTFYVSYNPDENNYHPVGHIPFIVQVVGEASKPDEGHGTTSGGNTGTGSGMSSSGSTGTGSDTTSSGRTSPRPPARAGRPTPAGGATG
ncbi:MAG: Ig-like domain-containing protein, partial [Lachnospiraceae bacterium]|nr:Ig-like domain-containing protein [Lachnospiraceae bacterium]